MPTSINHIFTECRDTVEALQKCNIPEHLYDFLGLDKNAITKSDVILQTYMFEFNLSNKQQPKGPATMT